MTRCIDRAVLLALGLAVPMALSAAQTATQTDDEELREVIITARSLEVTTPLELSTLGYDVEFVSKQQILNHGFVDTAQALEMLVPGAYVATQMGAFSYINLSLQGSRTGDVLWTMDGVRINNRLYNGTSPADTLPASHDRAHGSAEGRPGPALRHPGRCRRRQRRHPRLLRRNRRRSQPGRRQQQRPAHERLCARRAGQPQVRRLGVAGRDRRLPAL